LRDRPRRLLLVSVGTTFRIDKQEAPTVSAWDELEEEEEEEEKKKKKKKKKEVA
jgi:hypothetical protein